MSVRKITRRRAPVEERKAFEVVTGQVLRDVFMGARAFTGKYVTVEESFQADAVIGCVRLLSESVGAFPLKTYEGDPDGERELAIRHPTYLLLRRRPHPFLPPVTLWGLAMTHLVTWGDAFIGKRWRPGDRLPELWPIHPERVRIELRAGEKLFYVANENGVERPEPYTVDEIIHIYGFTLDGVRGVSPIELARESVGAGLAMDEFTNRFMHNGATPVGVLETDQELDDDAYNRVSRTWRKSHGGIRNAGKVAILEKGLKYHSLTIPLKDLEFVALHNLSARKVARIFRVPSSLIDVESSAPRSSMTYSNVQQDNIQFLVHTLRVWLKRVAETLMLDRDLFKPGEALFCEHDVDELLLMDTLTRFQANEIATGKKAWALPGEIRRNEKMDASASGKLDELATAPPPAPIAPAPTGGEKPAQDA